MLTLVKVVDLGFGPSADFLAVSNNTWNPITGTQNSSSSGVSFVPPLPRPGSGFPTLGSFCIEADVHEVFTNTGERYLADRWARRRVQLSRSPSQRSQGTASTALLVSDPAPKIAPEPLHVERDVGA